MKNDQLEENMYSVGKREIGSLARTRSIALYAGCVVALFGATACGGSDSGPSGELEEGPGAPVENQAATDGVNVESEEDITLITRVDGENGGAVAFYEAEPGHLIVLETGRVGYEPALGAEARGMTVTEQYEHLTGGPAPEILIAAESRAVERADALAAEEAPSSEAIADIEMPSKVGDRAEVAGNELQGNIAQSQQALTESEFRNTFCPIDSTQTDQAIWTWVTGTGSFTWTRLNWVDSSAMSLQGTIRLRARWRPRWSWSGWTNINLPAGHWARFYESYRPRLGFAWNGMVDQADGDLYHFCSLGSSSI